MYPVYMYLILSQQEEHNYLLQSVWIPTKGRLCSKLIPIIPDNISTVI